jgi:hypothetical protein
MNWRRGLFRLWIVGTALFVISIASSSYSSIKAEFDRAVVVKQTTGRELTLDECKSFLDRAPGKPDKPGGELTLGECKSLLHVWLEVLHREPNPWTRVGEVAGIAFGIPLVVLVLGASLVWAFSGFAATTRH